MDTGLRIVYLSVDMLARLPLRRTYVVSKYLVAPGPPGPGPSGPSLLVGLCALCLSASQFIRKRVA